MQDQRTGIKVAIFSAAMLVILAGLVVTFGELRFSSSTTYRAEFTSVSRLIPGQNVRIAGVRVGSVKDIAIQGDHAEVVFTVDKQYQLYTSTRAAIRYQDLVGARYLEILAGPGELRKLPPGAVIPSSHTEPALDLDALLSGLKPVLKGLDAAKINDISNGIIELLQGKGGQLADLMSATGSFTHTLADRQQLIHDVIDNLNTTLATVDAKGSQLDASVDQLQRVISTLSKGRDPIAGAIPPLASATTDLTDLLTHARRPLQGVLANLRPLATELDDRKKELNDVIEPLPENYLKFAALGSYGAFFNIYACKVRIKINGPAGSDILLPFDGNPDPSKGRCAFAK